MEKVEVHSPSTFRPQLDKISSKSTDNNDEKAILDSFKETNVDSIINTASSFQQKVAERINIMRPLYTDVTSYLALRVQYEKVAEKHYVYEKNFHKKFFALAENDFRMSMDMEYELVIHNKVHKYKLEPAILSDLKRKGLEFMKVLKHHIGFDTGLLEVIFAPEGSDVLTNADKNCCCPLHKKVRDLNFMNDNFVHNTCIETRPMAKMDLIRHLHVKAYTDADIFHYASLIYVKHIYGLSKYKKFNAFIDNMDEMSMYRPNTLVICDDKEDSADNHSKKKLSKYLLSSKIFHSNTSSYKFNVDITSTLNKASFSSLSNDDASSTSSSDLSTTSVTKIKLRYEYANKFIHKKDIVSNDVLCTSLNKSLENLKLCNIQFQNRHSKKLLQVVRTLQRDISEICDDYKCLQTKHLIHIHRFIENFRTNDIWNVGIIEKEFFSNGNDLSKKNKYSHLCVCPCSIIMNKWNSKSISKSTVCHKDMETVPCSTIIMSVDTFISHVKEFKEHDVYHRIVSETLKILHSIN